jgi:hypothetical protein
VIAAAAVCPCPPLLAPGLAGAADAGEVLPLLRDACAAAVDALVGADPDVVAVVGPDVATGTWPADGSLDIAAYAPALGRPPVQGQGRPALPLSLGIGALLLSQAGYAGPRAFHGIGADATPAQCLALGARLADSAPRVALLAMGDGTARRSVSAPGYLDERAAPFDESVARAVRDGDVAALARLDPDLAAELLAAGRPAWQVLAGALPDGGLETAVLYSDAPLGVAYLAGTLIPKLRVERAGARRLVLQQDGELDAGRDL